MDGRVWLWLACGQLSFAMGTHKSSQISQKNPCDRRRQADKQPAGFSACSSVSSQVCSNLRTWRWKIHWSIVHWQRPKTWPLPLLGCEVRVRCCQVVRGVACAAVSEAFDVVTKTQSEGTRVQRSAEIPEITDIQRLKKRHVLFLWFVAPDLLVFFVPIFDNCNQLWSKWTCGCLACHCSSFHHSTCTVVLL